jgi:outer membrane protein W
MKAYPILIASMALGATAQAATPAKTTPALGAQENGTWTFGGRVGGNASGGTLRTELALNAEYALADKLSWRTDLAFVFRDMQKQDVFDINVPTNLLFWPTGRNAKFRPYFGPGANFSRSYEGEATFGLNALAGVQLASTNNTTFGIEGKYLIPDITDAKSKPQLTFAMTGNFQFTK